MRGVEPTRKLPVLHATRLAPGGRLTDPEALAAVDVLAAAPEPLRERVKRVIWTGPKGLSLDLRQGPQLFFGTAERPEAKWMADRARARRAELRGRRLPRRPRARARRRGRPRACGPETRSARPST